MNKSRHAAFVASFVTALFLGASSLARASFVTLEDTPLDAADSYKDDWRPANGFTSAGAHFNNFIGEFGSWSGFALSRKTDSTTPGFGNQHSAWPGSGAEGSSKYAVAYVDADFGVIPTITLPAGESPVSLRIANTTYAALSMKNGDQFAKKFGGTTGQDPDFFKLTISGYDAGNQPTGFVEFYLADYRAPGTASDYIVSGWELVDVSSLPSATRKLQFTLNSSDTSGGFMNTPGYFAVDNLSTVPEPAAATLLLMAVSALAFRRNRA